jgi:hypothetical protein
VRFSFFSAFPPAEEGTEKIYLQERNPLVSDASPGIVDLGRGWIFSQDHRRLTGSDKVAVDIAGRT